MVFALANFLLAQLKAMGYVASLVTGDLVPYSWGVIGLAGLILFYETRGGMRAVQLAVQQSLRNSMPVDCGPAFPSARSYVEFFLARGSCLHHWDVMLLLCNHGWCISPSLTFSVSREYALLTRTSCWAHVLDCFKAALMIKKVKELPRLTIIGAAAPYS